MAGAAATGVGSWIIRPDWANAAAEPIKVGIATDLTGAIGYAGNANANVAKMLIKDLNAGGGLLGRPWSFISRTLHRTNLSQFQMCVS